MAELLFLTEYFPESGAGDITGGVENRYFYLLRELSKRHHVTLLCSTQRKEWVGLKQHIEGINVIRTSFQPYSSKGIIRYRLNLVKSFYRYSKNFNKFDVVEGTNFITYLPAYNLGSFLHSKKVATWHECWVGEWIKIKGLITGFLGEIWERNALKKKWDIIMAVSNVTKRKLSKYIDKKVEVIPNGIPLQEIRKISSKKYDTPSIVVTSRMVKTKRIDLV